MIFGVDLNTANNVNMPKRTEESTTKLDKKELKVIENLKQKEIKMSTMKNKEAFKKVKNSKDEISNSDLVFSELIFDKNEKEIEKQILKTQTEKKLKQFNFVKQKNQMKNVPKNTDTKNEKQTPQKVENFSEERFIVIKKAKQSFQKNKNQVLSKQDSRKSNYLKKKGSLNDLKESDGSIQIQEQNELPVIQLIYLQSKTHISSQQTPTEKIANLKFPISNLKKKSLVTVKFEKKETILPNQSIEKSPIGEVKDLETKTYPNHAFKQSIQEKLDNKNQSSIKQMQRNIKQVPSSDIPIRNSENLIKQKLMTWQIKKKEKSSAIKDEQSRMNESKELKNSPKRTMYFDCDFQTQISPINARLDRENQITNLKKLSTEKAKKSIENFEILNVQMKNLESLSPVEVTKTTDLLSDEKELNLKVPKSIIFETDDNQNDKLENNNLKTKQQNNKMSKFKTDINETEFKKLIIKNEIGRQKISQTFEKSVIKQNDRIKNLKKVEFEKLKDSKNQKKPKIKKIETNLKQNETKLKQNNSELNKKDEEIISSCFFLIRSDFVSSTEKKKKSQLFQTTQKNESLQKFEGSFEKSNKFDNLENAKFELIQRDNLSVLNNKENLTKDDQKSANFDEENVWIFEDLMSPMTLLSQTISVNKFSENEVTNKSDLQAKRKIEKEHKDQRQIKLNKDPNDRISRDKIEPKSKIEETISNRKFKTIIDIFSQSNEKQINPVLINAKSINEIKLNEKSQVTTVPASKDKIQLYTIAKNKKAKFTKPILKTCINKKIITTQTNSIEFLLQSQIHKSDQSQKSKKYGFKNDDCKKHQTDLDFCVQNKPNLQKIDTSNRIFENLTANQNHPVLTESIVIKCCSNFEGTSLTQKEFEQNQKSKKPKLNTQNHKTNHQKNTDTKNEQNLNKKTKMVESKFQKNTPLKNLKKNEKEKTRNLKINKRVSRIHQANIENANSSEDEQTPMIELIKILDETENLNDRIKNEFVCLRKKTNLKNKSPSHDPFRYQSFLNPTEDNNLILDDDSIMKSSLNGSINSIPESKKLNIKNREQTMIPWILLKLHNKNFQNNNSYQQSSRNSATNIDASLSESHQKSIKTIDIKNDSNYWYLKNQFSFEINNGLRNVDSKSHDMLFLEKLMQNEIIKKDYEDHPDCSNFISFKDEKETIIQNFETSTKNCTRNELKSDSKQEIWNVFKKELKFPVYYENEYMKNEPVIEDNIAVEIANVDIRNSELFRKENPPTFINQLTPKSSQMPDKYQLLKNMSKNDSIFCHIPSPKILKLEKGPIKTVSFFTHKGIYRPTNEDMISMSINGEVNFNQILSCLQNHHSDIFSIFSIFDGHGGDACSRFLKKNFNNIFFRNFDFEKNEKQCFEFIFEELEKEFTEFALRGNFSDSGSCVCSVVVFDDHFSVLNLGDSRCFLSKKEGLELIELTIDHKPESPTEFERILQNGGKLRCTSTHLKTDETTVYHAKNFGEIEVVESIKTKNNDFEFTPWRINPGGLCISRTIGDLSSKKTKFNGKPGMIIHVPTITENNYDGVDFVFIACYLIS